MNILILHHTTFKKTSGTQCKKKPDKGPIRHLGKYVFKYDKRHNLKIIANQTHQLHKWLNNKYINNILSNDFWKIPTIIDKKKHV